MARQHRRMFPRQGMGKWTESGPSGSALGSADYWPLTVTPQAMKPRRSKPWLVTTIGALIALSAALTFAFHHGIPAW